MKSPFSSPDPVADTAALWLARRDAGLTAAEEAEFDAWREADPRHAAAWAEVERAWTAFAPAQDFSVAAQMTRELARRSYRRSVRRFMLAGAAAAFFLAAMFLTDLRRSAAPPVEPLAAAAAPRPAAAPLIARPERRTLSDGSVVELNAGAAIAVDFSPAQRSIHLLHGEAHFVVAKNPVRPFVVTAGAVTVRAVGTQFVVRMANDAADVLVTEGRVAVNRTVLVNAGNRISVPLALADAAPAPQAVSVAETAHWLAWRGPRLVLSNTPLFEAVEALNRENPTQISVVDPHLANLRLSGVFSADNAEGFVRLVEMTYGAKVRRIDGRVILTGATR